MMLVLIICIWRVVLERYWKDVKQERWRAKQKLVFGSKHREQLQGSKGMGYDPPRKFLRLYWQNSVIKCIFWLKMVHNGVCNFTYCCFVCVVKYS